MRASQLCVRLSALTLVALALGACATQPRDEVRVGIGMQMAEPAPVRDYAALYTPYAMMATTAYTDKFAQQPALPRCRTPRDGASGRERQRYGLS